MISLDDDKAKKLAEVISNDTSRKILSFLSEQEATESGISKSLRIPMSTVTYNLKNLIKAGLIETKEFKWSTKGKEMDIFRVKKRHIIITPGRSEVKQDLKKLWPVVLGGAVIGGLIEIFTKKTVFMGEQIRANVDKATSGASEVAFASAPEVSTQVTQYSYYGAYFFIGVIFVLLMFMIFRRVRK